MADIVLKDENGADVTYEGIETVTFDTTTEGVQATYVESSLIPEQVQSDWAQEDDTAVDYIKNKPAAYVHPETHDAGMIVGLAAVATSGSYQDLADQPDLSQVGKQSDWAQEDTTAVDFIKNKPFGLLPDVLESVEAAGFTTNDYSYGVYSKTYPAYADRPEIVNGETYIVTWDGVDYTCVARDVRLNYTTMSGGLTMLCCLGNVNIRIQSFNNQAATEDTLSAGEPFFVYAGCYWYTAETDDSHTVRIRKADNTKKLERKYLPDIPAFDLEALGLGAVAVGGSASAEFDTAELMAALGQGPVKLTLTVNVGAAEQVSVVVNSIHRLANDSYNAAYVGVLSGTVMMLSVTVDNNSVTAQIMLLATT